VFGPRQWRAFLEPFDGVDLQAVAAGRRDGLLDRADLGVERGYHHDLVNADRQLAAVPVAPATPGQTPRLVGDDGGFSGGRR
jgi:hypothetical protein